MSKKKFVLALSAQDRQRLIHFVNTGVHAARAIKRARIVLFAEAGYADPAIAEEVGVCLATVFNTRRRFCQNGLDAILTEKPRPGQPRRLDGRQEATLTAITCSTPPDGRQRWTMELLADRLVHLHVVETISDSTVQRVLKKTTSSPGKNGNGASVRSRASS
jgi:transposase